MPGSRHASTLTLPDRLDSSMNWFSPITLRVGACSGFRSANGSMTLQRFLVSPAAEEHEALQIERRKVFRRHSQERLKGVFSFFPLGLFRVAERELVIGLGRCLLASGVHQLFENFPGSLKLLFCKEPLRLLETILNVSCAVREGGTEPVIKTTKRRRLAPILMETWFHSGLAAMNSTLAGPFGKSKLRAALIFELSLAW